MRNLIRATLTLNEVEWQHILGLIENDIKYGRDIFTTRFNLEIYDKIYKALQDAGK